MCEVIIKGSWRSEVLPFKECDWFTVSLALNRSEKPPVKNESKHVKFYCVILGQNGRLVYCCV